MPSHEKPTTQCTKSKPGKRGSKETSSPSLLFVSFFWNRITSSLSSFCFGNLLLYLLGQPFTNGESLVRGCRWLSSSSSAWLMHHTRQATLLLLLSLHGEWLASLMGCGCTFSGLYLYCAKSHISTPLASNYSHTSGNNTITATCY